MIDLVKNEWKKVFLPVLLTTVLLAIAMSVLSCTIYQNYVLHYDLEVQQADKSSSAQSRRLMPMVMVRISRC